ncbi:unnamed protein product [marine sediment metagenome]|uniref:Uncharacterized protein n=1 Tax=marine sediment metagenome TaxID=412755 RepID=X0ZMM6_9ZZZZ
MEVTLELIKPFDYCRLTMTNNNLWNDEELDREEYEFLPLDNIGTPTFFRVGNWNSYEELSFRNQQGNLFTRTYLHTTAGLLPLSSVRLRRELKKFADANEKGELTIQRWCEGSDTRSTVFKVELHKGVVVKKKKPPVQKRPKSK